MEKSVGFSPQKDEKLRIFAIFSLYFDRAFSTCAKCDSPLSFKTTMYQPYQVTQVYDFYMFQFQFWP